MNTPAATTSWQATPGHNGGLNIGGAGSDQQIAVSSTHVIVSGRAALAFYTRSGVRVYDPTSVETFFTAQGLPASPTGSYGIYDLRLLFDAYRNRFWVCALTTQNGPGKQVPSFLCAVSKTENPLDGFYHYWWDSVPTAAGSGFQAGDTSDYPCIGIAPHVFVQTNKVAHGTTYKHWRVVLRDADAMAKGTIGSQVAGWEWWGWTNAAGAQTYIIQPAIHHGATDKIFLAHKYNNAVEIFAISNPLTPTMTYHRTDVQLSGASGTLVDGAQKGSKTTWTVSPIRLGPQIGDAILKAVYRNGHLYCTANNAKNWTGSGVYAAGRVLWFNVSAYPTASLEMDRTFGSASAGDPAGELYHYGWPSLEVNKNGDVVLTTTRTNSSIYPEVRLSKWFAGEADIRSSVLLKSGEAPYAERSFDSNNNQISAYYGETVASSVDPVDDTAIWFASQYPIPTTNPSSFNWSMWVGKL